MDDSRLIAIDRISSVGIIPLFCSKDFDICKSICKTIINSGCSIIEFGLREKNSINIYKKLYEYAKNENENILFGAGSATKANVASQLIDIGTDFIISPGFNNDINTICNNKKICYVPGAATVSEIMHLNNIGKQLIKIFPIKQLGGLDFYKAIQDPLPWLKGIPAGGVSASEESINLWLKAGATAVTLGSDLFQRKLIEEKCYSEIEKKLSSLLNEAKRTKLSLTK